MVLSMNNEYVRELLHQESIRELGYPPESGVREDWYGGNDYYNDILVNRQNQINELTIIKDKTQAYINTLPPGPLKDELIERVIKLEARINELKKFGYDAIQYTYDAIMPSRYPYLEARKDELSKRFKYIYGNMRIGYNTAEQFNEHLQALFDDIAPKYENLLRLQILYENQILDNTRELKNLDVSDITDTDSTTDTFYFNEQDPNVGRKALENVSKASTKSKTLQSQIKNIMSGYMLDQSVLKDYLNEFGVLFIRVWGDRTRW